MNKKIKFIESHNFVGEFFEMIVDGKYHRLKYTRFKDYKDDAVSILKNEYNIEMKKEDIEFEWDGSL